MKLQYEKRFRDIPSFLMRFSTDFTKSACSPQECSFLESNSIKGFSKISLSILITVQSSVFFEFKMNELGIQ